MMKKGLCLILAVLLAACVFAGCAGKVDERLAGSWEPIAGEDLDFNDQLVFEFVPDRKNPGLYDGTLRVYKGHKLITEDNTGVYYKYNTDVGTHDYGELEIIIPGGEFMFGTKFRLEGDEIYGTEEGNEGPVFRREDKSLSEEEQDKIKAELVGMWEDVHWKSWAEKDPLLLDNAQEEERIKTFWKFNEDGTIETYVGDGGCSLRGGWPCLL